MKFSRKNFRNSSELLTFIFLLIFSIIYPIIWANQQGIQEVFILICLVWIYYGIRNYFGYQPRIIIDDKGIQFKSHFKKGQIRWEDIRTVLVIKYTNGLFSTRRVDVTENIPERGDIWVLTSSELSIDFKRIDLINSNKLILFQYRKNAFELLTNRLKNTNSP